MPTVGAMRLAFVSFALFATACATIPTVEPPEPPRLEGDVPAIGRTLDLEVEGRGTPIRLQGVTGRVTAVCVLGAGGAPELDAEASQVLGACQDALAELQDQIAVVALTTDGDLDLDSLPLRAYRDPGGKALEEKLELEPVSQVIVVDNRGRVAQVLPAGESGRLRDEAVLLIH